MGPGGDGHDRMASGHPVVRVISCGRVLFLTTVVVIALNTTLQSDTQRSGDWWIWADEAWFPTPRLAGHPRRGGEDWSAPVERVVVSAHIPATVSKFNARDAFVYLPRP